MIIATTVLFIVVFCSFKSLVNSEFYEASQKLTVLLTTKTGGYHLLLLFIIGVLILDNFIFNIFIMPESNIVLSPYLAICACILLASKHFSEKFEVTSYRSNERVDLSSSFLAGISFACNILFIIARACVYFIFALLFVYMALLYVQMHTTLSYTAPYLLPLVGVNQTRWFLPIEYMAFLFFNMKRKVSTTFPYFKENYLNPNAVKLHSFLLHFFDPINPFNGENVNFLNLHVTIFTIVIIVSFIYGFTAISAEKKKKSIGDDNEDNEDGEDEDGDDDDEKSVEQSKANTTYADFEKQSKQEFVCGFLIISLLICFCYIFLYIFQLIQG